MDANTNKTKNLLKQKCYSEFFTQIKTKSYINDKMKQV